MILGVLVVFAVIYECVIVIVTRYNFLNVLSSRSLKGVPDGISRIYFICAHPVLNSSSTEVTTEVSRAD